jgi:hypothetical protein
MELEMVLNELSLRPIANNIPTARQRMSDLILTAIVATRHGVKSVMRTYSNLDTEELAPGYPVARWRNDGKVDIEMQRFYRTLVTKSPFLDDITNPDILNSVDLSDCFCGEDRAIGLGVAFWLEALAVSLRSETRWYDTYLQIRISQIGDDEEIEDTFEEIPHTSRSDHIREHLVWIAKRLREGDQTQVRDGIDIWQHKADWFPSLYFCETVGEQMRTLLHANLMLMPIMKRLRELEDFCKAWYEGPFDHNKISSKATAESTATLEMYGSQRTFQCHDGETRLFSWHIRLTPGSWRLYFYPLPEEKKLIIGYIGPHLPTVHYPH